MATRNDGGGGRWTRSERTRGHTPKLTTHMTLIMMATANTIAVSLAEIVIIRVIDTMTLITPIAASGSALEVAICTEVVSEPSRLTSSPVLRASGNSSNAKHECSSFSTPVAVVENHDPWKYAIASPFKPLF